MEWTTLITIAEAIALSLSVLGVVGLGWYVASTIVKKLVD